VETYQGILTTQRSNYAGIFHAIPQKGGQTSQACKRPRCPGARYVPGRHVTIHDCIAPPLTTQQTQKKLLEPSASIWCIFLTSSKSRFWVVVLVTVRRNTMPHYSTPTVDCAPVRRRSVFHVLELAQPQIRNHDVHNKHECGPRCGFRLGANMMTETRTHIIFNSAQSAVLVRIIDSEWIAVDNCNWILLSPAT
jgi:hypothetical protein